MRISHFFAPMTSLRRGLSVSTSSIDLFNPTQTHKELRESVRSFCEKEVMTQSAEWDREEKFNIKLFQRLGDLGLLGITVSPEYGGMGMDATAAVIAHEEVQSYFEQLFLLFFCSYKLQILLFASHIWLIRCYFATIYLSMDLMNKN